MDFVLITLQKVYFSIQIINKHKAEPSLVQFYLKFS